MKELNIDRHSITITHPERIYFPDAKITKQDLIDYYLKVAPFMLPYMKSRPLTMHRFPEGITGKDFYQKDAPSFFPSWIKRQPIPREDGQLVNYVVCNNTATLVYIANQGCITPHLFTSRIDKLDYPDRLVFDLDPSDGDFKKVQKAARLLKSLLDEFNMPSYVMVTGSRGLHIWIPLRRTQKFEMVKTFAHHVARAIEHLDPGLCTTQIRKEKRGNKVFIDWLRNNVGQTSVAPYAVRAKPGAPIATPISWQEAFEASMSPQKYTLKNILLLLRKRDDPWQLLARSVVSLGKVQRELEKQF